MDFSEDYNCRSQDEVQSAYWNNISVTLHPVVVHYMNNLDEDLTVKSYVIVSNESRHDARFVHSTREKMAIEIKNFVPQVTFYHYFTDSPTSQYRNKSIFKIISCHEEYFGAPAAWNYSEAGHGKGPCDPIGGTAKRKADHAVRHGKASIQGAHDFFAWSLNDCEQSKITYLFLSTEDYDRSEGFLTSACNNISPIQGTMEIHAVIGIGPNKVYVRNTSCYCINCFLSAFKKSTCCDGWREVDMRRNDAKKAKTKSRDEKQPAHSTRVPVNLKRRAPVNTSSAPAFSSAEVVIEVDDFIAAIYRDNGRVYIEKVTDVDESDAFVSFLEHRGEMSNIYPRL